MHRFPEHREPWGSALSSSLWSYSSTCSWVCLALSSSGTGHAEGGRLPPSPAVCGTRGRLGSGCWPSSIHSSTADRWRWHRRMGQTSHRSACPGTRHTSGRPAHTVSLPPGPERRQETGLSKASLTRLQSRSCVGSARFFTSLCALPAPWSVGAQPHTELCSHNSWGRTELGAGQTTAQGKGCFRKAYKPEKVGPHQACQGDRRLKGGLGLLLWWKAFQTVPEISWTPGTAGGGAGNMLGFTHLNRPYHPTLCITRSWNRGCSTTALQGAFNRPSETKLHDMKPFQSQRKHMLVRVSISQSLEKRLDCEFLCFEHQE